MLASVVNIVNKVITMRKEPNRTTITLPPELNEEALRVCEQTGVSLSDVCRQGIVRILLEMRETGTVKLMQLPRAA